MPQMSPMNWIFLFFLFNFSLMLMMTKMFFIFNKVIINKELTQSSSNKFILKL